MSKLAALRKTSGDVARESMGIKKGGEPRAGSPPPKDERLKGVSRPRQAVLQIPLGKIAPDPYQPRKEFNDEDLALLGQSLKDRGQLQPIRVRWDETARIYRVITGERRYRAACRAELQTLDCVVDDRTVLPQDLLVDQLVENLVRADLEPLEEAEGLQALQRQTGESARQLAARLGVATSRVTKALALLTLPEEVRDLVWSNDLAASTAYALTGLDDPWEQIDLASLAVAEDWTRAAVEEKVREFRHRRETAAAVQGAPATDGGTAAMPAAGVTTGPPAGPRIGQAGEPGSSLEVPALSGVIHGESPPPPADQLLRGPGVAPGPEDGDAGAGGVDHREPGVIHRESPPKAEGTGFTTPEMITGPAPPGVIHRESPPPTRVDSAAPGVYAEFHVGSDGPSIGGLRYWAFVRVNCLPGKGNLTVIEALELALDEARRRHGPTELAVCNRCNTARPLGEDPCPRCQCQEYRIEPGPALEADA